MESEKIRRINELARKAKEAPLSDAEAAEQAALRKDYIEEFRSSLKRELDHTYIKAPDGTLQKLKNKND